jgi:ABC-type bacteriocin/lantibiotic exporter with double-glycine peptidase domain
MEHAAQFFAHLVESVSAVETVKAFGAERDRAEEGDARLVPFSGALLALRKLGPSQSAVGMFTTALAGVVILWYGG